MAILAHLQRSIERLHAVEIDLDVRTYVVDEATRRAIPGARDLPEQLFVRECDDGLELALFIEPRIVEMLEHDHPERRLHAGNLEGYCVALEGVSHFVLLAWRAQRNWPVSALEMEIQAEVDKFVSAWLLLASQGRSRLGAAEQLRRQLFESYRLDAEVPGDESNRYHTATRVAGRFCAGLARRFGRDRDNRRIHAQVRDFYRRGLAEKLRAA